MAQKRTIPGGDYYIGYVPAESGGYEPAPPIEEARQEVDAEPEQAPKIEATPPTPEPQPAEDVGPAPARVQPHQELVRMYDSGVQTLEIIDYINRHPDAMHGAEASRVLKKLIDGMTVAQQIEFINKHPTLARRDYYKKIIKKIREQLREYRGLEGREQFNKAIELGFIPEGSEYVEGVEPVSPDVLIKMEEVGAPQQEIREVQAGRPAGYYTAEQAQEIREVAQQRQEQVREFREMVDERKEVLGDYRVGDRYDLVAAIQGGVKPDKLQELGFEGLDVLDAQRQAMAISNFERNILPTMPPELREVYEEKGAESYNRAVEELNKQYEGLNKQYQADLKAVQPYFAGRSISPSLIYERYKREGMTPELREIISTSAAYDVNRAIVDNKVPEATLVRVFGQEAVDLAKKQVGELPDWQEIEAQFLKETPFSQRAIAEGGGVNMTNVNYPMESLLPSEAVQITYREYGQLSEAEKQRVLDYYSRLWGKVFGISVPSWLEASSGIPMMRGEQTEKQYYEAAAASMEKMNPIDRLESMRAAGVITYEDFVDIISRPELPKDRPSVGDAGWAEWNKRWNDEWLADAEQRANKLWGDLSNAEKLEVAHKYKFPPEAEIAGQIAVSAVPIVGTYVYWDTMSPTWRVVSVAADSLFFITPFIMPYLKKGFDSVVRALKTVDVNAGDDVARILAAQTDIVVDNLKKSSAALMPSFDDVARAGAAYGDDFARVAVLEQLRANNWRGVANIPEAVLTLNEARARLPALSTALKRVVAQYVDDIVKAFNVTDPQVLRGLNSMPDDYLHYVRSIANSITSPSMDATALRKLLNAANLALEQAKIKYPTDPTKWYDLLADVSDLKARLVVAEMGDITKLSGSLAAARENYTALKDLLQSAPKGSQYYDDLVSQVNRAKNLIDDLSEQLGKTITYPRLEWLESGGGYYGGARRPVSVGPLPGGSGGISGGGEVVTLEEFPVIGRVMEGGGMVTPQVGHPIPGTPVPLLTPIKVEPHLKRKPITMTVRVKTMPEIKPWITIPEEEPEPQVWPIHAPIPDPFKPITWEFIPRAKPAWRPTRLDMPDTEIQRITLPAIEEALSGAFGKDVSLELEGDSELIMALDERMMLAPGMAGQYRDAIEDAVRSSVEQSVQTMAKTETGMGMAMQRAVEVATTTAVKASSVPGVNSAVSAAVRSQTRPATEAMTQTVSSTKTAVATAYSPTEELITPILVSNKEGKAVKKLTKEERATASAWPQGFGWWVVYRGKDGKLRRLFHKGQKPPSGIRQVRQGEGEAYRGIQQHKGKKAMRFIHPMGAVDVTVDKPERVPGRGGAIRFTPQRPRITPRRPRIR